MSDELKEFLSAHDGLSEFSVPKQRILRELGLELANSTRGKPMHGKATARSTQEIMNEIVEKHLGDLLPPGPYTSSEPNELNFNALAVMAAPVWSKMLKNQIETEEGAGNSELAAKHRKELTQLMKAHEILNTVIETGEKEYQKRKENGFRLGC